MSDHSYFEELTALAVEGHISEEESSALREHLAVCSECRQRAREFQYLLRSALPLVDDRTLGLIERLKARPDPGVRERFLARARTEGARFSPNVDRSVLLPWLRLGHRTAVVAALAGVVLVGGFYGPSVFRRAALGMRETQDTALLKQEKEALSGRLVQRERELALQQQEIGELRDQLKNALKSAEDYRRESDKTGARLEQSTGRTAQLLEELQNRDKQLAASSAEISRINDLRLTDKVSLDAQQARIKEISDQLRIADATLDMERQFAAAGKDIRELLVARQLHVVDIRDTDANGKPSQAFARVFLTDGKSLMFFAFDLSNPTAMSAKARFQVWGEQLGKKGSVRSLGVLSMDRAQNRWALKVENAGLLSEVNSVFVTVSSAGRAGSGQRLLYAYLGEPKHS